MRPWPPAPICLRVEKAGEGDGAVEEEELLVQLVERAVLVSELIEKLMERLYEDMV